MGNFFEKNSCLEKKHRYHLVKGLFLLYAVLRYLLPLVAPFVFAFFIVRILYPQLCRAEKRLRIRKDILMAGFLLLLTGILAAGFFFLLSKGTAWAVKIGSESGAINRSVLGDRDDRGILAVQGLCAFFGMDEKERDLGKY